MKMKAVQSLLSSGKRAILFHGDEQWIGDGYAAYPLHGLPRLEKDNLKAFLDCNEKQWEKFFVQEEKLPFSIEDNILEETDLEYIGLMIRYAECDLIPLIGAGHIYFIQNKYIRPLTEDITFHLRRTDGGQYCIAVKEGLILRAVIMPYECINDDLNGILMRLSVNCDSELRYLKEKQKAAEDCEKYEDMMFEEDEK